MAWKTFPKQVCLCLVLGVGSMPAAYGEARDFQATWARAATAADGTKVGALQADVVSVLIGVNDWQGGVPLATYSNRLDAFLTNLRTLQPAAPCARKRKDRD